jgi:hypothetical protein
MMNKPAAAAVAALVVASAWVAPAYVRHALRHGRPYANVPARIIVPAGMTEARPGLWVAGFQCITGLGRDCRQRDDFASAAIIRLK